MMSVHLLSHPKWSLYVNKQEVRNSRHEWFWSLISWCILLPRSNIWLRTAVLVWSLKQWMCLTKSSDPAENQTLYQNKSCEIPFHFDCWSTTNEKYYKKLIQIMLYCQITNDNHCISGYKNGSKIYFFQIFSENRHVCNCILKIIFLILNQCLYIKTNV
jgi:hypothetical protein